MSTTLIVILVAVVAVGLFVLGMSLTLIFKGHNIKSEIGDNENMRARGLKCAVQEERELQGLTEMDCQPSDLCGDKTCSTCFPQADNS